MLVILFPWDFILVAILLAIFRRFAKYVLGAILIVVILSQIVGMAFVRNAPRETTPQTLTAEIRAALSQMVTQNSGPISVTLAAYPLAQLAYIENRPQDIAPMLEVMTEERDLDSAAHQQRVDIMREWAAANGHPSGQAWTSLVVSMSVVRGIGAVLLPLGLAALALGFLAAAVIPIAMTRRGRIGTLIEDVRRTSLHAL